MDTRNVIAAISLSAAVIILYSLFFAEPPNTKVNLAEKKNIEQNTDTPSLDQKETLVQISRKDALKESERVQFENQSIIGSISLKGAAIDDLTFKNYNTELESNEKVCIRCVIISELFGSNSSPFSNALCASPILFKLFNKL